MSSNSRLTLVIAFLVGAAGPADDPKKAWARATATDELSLLLRTLNGGEIGNRVPIHEPMESLERQLERPESSEATATRILERRREYDLGATLDRRLSEMAREGKRVPAAALWIQCLRAKLTARTLGGGGVVIGQVALEDGKLDPESVLAQMPILTGGYFAGEVRSFSKPIRFRAFGYQELEVPLAGKAGAIIDVGKVVLKPLPADQTASFRAKVQLDIPERGPATASVSLTVPRTNVPYFGIAPRRRWPEPTPVSLGKDGVLQAKGLTPGEYYLQIQAKDHAVYGRVVKVSPGKELDRGTIRLHATDLGYFIGKPAPTDGLIWESDFAATARRAAVEKRPVLLLMTAKQCGRCNSLERGAFSDPWVKRILSPFIGLKLCEDKAVEALHAPDGYPTVVFLNSEGNEVHRTSGPQPPTLFLGECARAFKKLGIALPAELRILVEKKIVADR
jgi:hypothetical protein